MVPCRMPIWFAGVVAGSIGVHSTIRYAPLRIHRERFGRVPATISPLQDRKGDAFQLHEGHTGQLRVRHRGLGAAGTAHEVREGCAVGPRGDEPPGEGRHGRHDPAGPEGRPERRQFDPGNDREGDEDHQGPAQQGQQDGAGPTEDRGCGDQERTEQPPDDAQVRVRGARADRSRRS
jgi:hypothetical protein